MTRIHTYIMIHSVQAETQSSRPAEGERVNLEELLAFIFPSQLQHPKSTGRLFAFGAYGPLKGGRLYSGHKQQHVVGGWELDCICKEFDREDVLRVYVQGYRDLFVLSKASQEEVIAQSSVKFGQISPEEVKMLFAPLMRGEDGCVSFHDAQKVIAAYREKRVQMCKSAYPSPGMMQLIAPPLLPPVPRTSGFGLEETVCGRTKSGTRLVSRKVAPHEMFMKDEGFSDMELASQTIKLLSTRAHKVCNIKDGNHPGLVQNVKLVRTDPPPGVGAWDANCCLRKCEVRA